MNRGSTLGALSFGADTAAQFRHDVLASFLAHYLKDGAPAMDVAPVTAGCTIKLRPLYVLVALRADEGAPVAGKALDDAYVSDPARPVTFRPRPIQPVGYDNGLTWPNWL